jgi:Protein of unknown function (DUF2569)
VPLIIVLCVTAGVIIWLTCRSARKYPGELKGVGGWLALLAISVTLAPLAWAKMLVMLSVGLDPDLWRRVPVALAGQMALCGLLFVFSCLLVIRLFRKSASFRRGFVQVGLFGLLLNPLTMLWVSFAASIETGERFSNLLARVADWREHLYLLPYGISLALWTVYLMRSRRVANTFVN